MTPELVMRRLLLCGLGSTYSFLEGPIPCHECFQDVRDQGSGIDRFTVRLRVHDRVAFEFRLQDHGAGKGDLDGFRLWQRTQA